MASISLLMLLAASVCWTPVATSTKPFAGSQRIFTDARAIEFVDPSKHGFHIVLREDFVSTHLQPVHAPTVYASAIALQGHHDPSSSSIGGTNRSASSKVATTSSNSGGGLLRATKTLYPENGNPDDGLLDGRTIKLLGLREKTWYYVCVEFESNLRRHELVTGMSCQLKRTLDKFGQNVNSLVTESQLLDATDRSIGVELTANTDFPAFFHVYLNPPDEAGAAAIGGGVASPPSQTFSVRPSGQNQRLLIYFGPYLQADTSYGRVCVIEEPKVAVYTAMGRAIRLVSESCYLDGLKTKATAAKSSSTSHGRKASHDSSHSPLAQVRNQYVGGAPRSASSAAEEMRFAGSTSVLVFVIPMIVQLFWAL